MAAGVADGGLDFLEGDNLDSKLRASRGQRSIKRSSTVKKTKRRTLARDSSKPQPSAKDVLAEPEVALSFDGAMEVLQSCEGGDMKETATLDRLLKALNVIERDLEEEGDKLTVFHQKRGVSLILLVMREVEGDGDIAAVCCWTLASTCTREDLCSLVLKGDGCRLVLSVMRRHKTVPVQHAGLSALCNMAISEGNRKGLCDVGVVQGVMAAFECCPHSEWVVFIGAQVFQNISGTSELCPLVVQSSVVKAFRKFVEQMSDHDDLLQSVCWTVSCVAFATDDSSRVALYEDGALDVVCTALRSSPSHTGVQFTGCSAMSNLARAELLLESIVEQGAVDLLCSSLSAHERHQGVQAVALRTLVLLTEDEMGLSQMRVKGLEAVCKRSLQLFREGPVVPEAEELQRRIQVANTEERRRRLKCTVL